MRFSPITSMFAIDKEWLEKRGEVAIHVRVIDAGVAADLRAAVAEAPILEEAQIAGRSTKNPWYEYRDSLTVLCRIYEGAVPEAKVEAEEVPAKEPPPLFDSPKVESADEDEVTETTLGQVLATIMQQIAVLQNTVDAIANAQGMILGRAYGLPVPQPSDEFFAQFNVMINRAPEKKIVGVEKKIVVVGG